MNEVKRDLISKSDAIAILKETGIIQDNDLGHLVIEEIDRIPTAYDVQKVIEQEHNYLRVIVSPRSRIYKGIMDIIRRGGKE